MVAFQYLMPLLTDQNYILINLYNANTESEQLEVMSQLVLILEEFDINQEKNIVLAGGFNFFTVAKLEAMSGSPALKKKLVAKLTEIEEGFELCDISRI